jgi:hypothetical protein
MFDYSDEVRHTSSYLFICFICCLFFCLFGRLVVCLFVCLLPFEIALQFWRCTYQLMCSIDYKRHTVVESAGQATSEDGCSHSNFLATSTAPTLKCDVCTRRVFVLVVMAAACVSAVRMKS